jgi:hypothetical protein
MASSDGTYNWVIVFVVSNPRISHFTLNHITWKHVMTGIHKPEVRQTLELLMVAGLARSDYIMSCGLKIKK